MMCPDCKLDFNWFEYILKKNEDSGYNNTTIGCNNDKEVTECPNFKIYDRDTMIGTFLDGINIEEKETKT